MLNSILSEIKSKNPSDMDENQLEEMLKDLMEEHYHHNAKVWKEHQWLLRMYEVISSLLHMNGLTDENMVNEEERPNDNTNPSELDPVQENYLFLIKNKDNKVIGGFDDLEKAKEFGKGIVLTENTYVVISGTKTPFEYTINK